MGESSRPNMKLAITSEKAVTVDDIIDEAIIIWKKAQTHFHNIARDDIDGMCALMSQLRDEHRQFCQSYPIVLRYMCELREFSVRAFRKYLRKIEKHPWKTEAEYLDSQVDYIVLLYKAMHPKWKKNEVDNLRINTRNQLQCEHDRFKNMVDKCNNDVNAREDVLRAQNREELKKFILSTDTLDRAGTIRTEVDPAISGYINDSSVDARTLSAGTSIGTSADAHVCTKSYACNCNCRCTRANTCGDVRRDDPCDLRGGLCDCDLRAGLRDLLPTVSADTLLN